MGGSLKHAPAAQAVKLPTNPASFVAVCLRSERATAYGRRLSRIAATTRAITTPTGTPSNKPSKSPPKPLRACWGKAWSQVNATTTYPSTAPSIVRPRSLRHHFSTFITTPGLTANRISGRGQPSRTSIGPFVKRQTPTSPKSLNHITCCNVSREAPFGGGHSPLILRRSLTVASRQRITYHRSMVPRFLSGGRRARRRQLAVGILWGRSAPVFAKSKPSHRTPK